LAAPGDAGRVRFNKRLHGGDFDYALNVSNGSQQQWMRDHFFRMSVYSPFFDSKTSWYPNAWGYVDLYALYKGSNVAVQHPDWILRDGSGRAMYIPYGCNNGSCPQYAGNPGNLAFRQYIIQAVSTMAARGYKGVWMDDVNMWFRVGDGYGNETPPIDPNTGTYMTWDNWRRYIAEFTEAIRAAVPRMEIVHNTIWYAGLSGVRDMDPFIRREIAAADYINLERGVNDDGLTGGTGDWALRTFFGFIDRVHAAGRSVIFDEYQKTDRDYALASYMLMNDGRDLLGEGEETQQGWWSGYDVSLGDPLGPRYLWNGLIRRDFQGGVALVNEPNANHVNANLGGVFSQIGGGQVSSVSLDARQGVVLLAPQTLTSNPIRIKCGGPAYTDPFGVTWGADSFYSTSQTYGTGMSIGNTNTPALYQSERWSQSNLQYNIPIANGHYNVTLKFAEIFYTSAGTRVFNVVLNGQQVLTNFDPLLQAGGSFRAVDRSFGVDVTNGLINLTLLPVINEPKISAIQITQ